MAATQDQDALVVRLRAAGCVYAEEEARLLRAAAAEGPDLEALVARRVAGEPLEPLLGFVEFAGLRLVVTPGVFVPRRRTELLAREAAARSRPGEPVVDLCCGCGAVAAAWEASVPGLEVHAVDVDPVAVACARANVSDPARVHTGDLFDALPARLRGRLAVVAANAPYVPTEELGLMPVEARLHEPQVALDGGEHGVAVHARIIAGAADWLAPGGHLLVETGRAQAERAAALMDAGNLTVRMIRDDSLEATVVVGGRGPGDHR